MALPVGITHLGDATFFKRSVMLEALIWTPAVLVLQLHAKPFISKVVKSHGMSKSSQKRSLVITSASLMVELGMVWINTY